MPAPSPVPARGHGPRGHPTCAPLAKPEDPGVARRLPAKAFRTWRTTLLGAALATAAACTTSQDPSAGAREAHGTLPEDTPRVRLQETLDSLQATANYAAALVVADSLDAELARDERPEWERVDLRWRRRTLERLAGATPSEQQAWATADSLARVRQEHRRRRRMRALAPLLQREIQLRQRILGTRHPQVAALQREAANQLRADGDVAEAETRLRAVLQHEREALGDDHPEVGRTLASLALTLPDQGRFAEADSLARQAIRLHTRALGSTHPDIAEDLDVLAIVAFQEQRYAETEVYDRRRLQILHDVYGPGDPHWIAAQHDVAATLSDIGDAEAALALYDEVLAVLRQRYGEEHFYVAFTEQNRALSLLALGRAPQAAEVLTGALATLQRDLGTDAAISLRAAVSTARALAAAGRLAEASALIDSTLMQLQSRAAEHEDVAKALAVRAQVRAQRGENATAHADLARAVEIARARLGPASALVARLLRERGTLEKRQGDLDTAIATLREACESFELARWRASTDALERAAFAAGASPYRLLALAHLQRGDGDAAWSAAERDRARALLELLATPALRQLTPEERRRERQLEVRLRTLQNALTRLSNASTVANAAREGANPEAARGLEAARVDSLRARLLAARAEWAALQRRLAEKYPMTEGAAFGRREVQEQLRARQALVGWLEAEDQRWGWVLRKHGSVRWARLPGADAVSVADSLRARLGDPDASADALRNLASALHAAQLAPLEVYLEDVTRLVVVPSGCMRGVPVEVLASADGVALAERFVVSYAPSATVYAWLHQHRQRAARPARLLALADPQFDTLPPLPGTRAEVETLARWFPDADVLLGPDATEAALRVRLVSTTPAVYSHLHLATHAIADGLRGERSALFVTPPPASDPLAAIAAGQPVDDGRVTMEEVMRTWHLNAPLVVLSACETARGAERTGEGTIGFAHALFRAGARCLVASQWAVADRPTRLLMQRFYANLLQRQLAVPEALREAKQWLRQRRTPGGRRPYAHPGYWAAFVAIGV